MFRNSTLSRVVQLAVVSGLAAGGTVMPAQAAETSIKGPPNANSPVGPGAAEQNRSGGQFNPGGAPTKNQATTQPSIPPNGVAAMPSKRSGGDFGPGGAPTIGQAANNPSGHDSGGDSTQH
jgi:hypothetical protein